MRRWVLAVLASAALSGVGVSDALAAETPDIVRLKNGGMIRGTIQDYVPGDHVVITLASGEERRIPGDEIAEAGPARTQEAAPPPAAKPAPAAAGPQPRIVAHGKDDPTEVRFQHEGDKPIAFYVRTGTQHGTVSGWSSGSGLWAGTVSGEAYEEICTAPCAATVQKGTYKLALSRFGGKPVPADGLVTIRGPVTLKGTYDSFEGLRTAGVIMVVVGGSVMLLGPLAAMSSTSENCGSLEPCEAYDTTLAVGTLVGGGLVMLTGFFFAFKKDEATLTVQPGVAASRSRQNVAQEPAPRGTPFGLTGAIRF